MHTYEVRRDFFHNDRIHREGDAVDMSERQARYLLISGANEKADADARNNAPVEVSPKPKKKRATVKKKSGGKDRTSEKSE